MPYNYTIYQLESKIDAVVRPNYPIGQVPRQISVKPSHAVILSVLNWEGKPHPNSIIQDEIKKFIALAKVHPNLRFVVPHWVGWDDAQIAPMFIGSPSNVYFPHSWRPFLEGF